MYIKESKIVARKKERKKERTRLCAELSKKGHRKKENVARKKEGNKFKK